jgi:hypothetical protein
MPVVFGDLVKTLSRYVPPACDVFQKGQHIVEAFRAAERQYQERVIGLRRIVESGTAHTNLS